MFRNIVVVLVVCAILSEACIGNLNQGKKKRKPLNIIITPGTGSATVSGGGGGGAVPPGGSLAPSSSATPTGRR